MLSFVYAGRLGSYTLAAKQLGVTQSAISHSIRAFEEDLGQKLFERSGRNLYLTAAGEQLLPECEDLLGRMQRMRRRLAERNHWGAGRLRIGIATSMAAFLLPEVLREFRASFPQVDVFIQPGSSPSCLRSLMASEVDIALIIEPPEYPADLAHQAYMVDDLHLVLSPKHRWSRRARISMDDLASETVFLNSKRDYTTHLIRTSLRREGADLGAVIEMGNHEAVIGLVKVGEGVAFFPEWIARRDVEEGTLVVRSIPKVQIRRQWVYCWREDSMRTLFEETFVGLCLEAKGKFDASDVRRFALKV